MTTETKPSAELLPCPFCGRTDLLGIETQQDGFLAVVCRACGCVGRGGTSTTYKEVCAHWNKRAHDSAIRNEALEDAAKECELNKVAYEKRKDDRSAEVFACEFCAEEIRSLKKEV